MAGNIPFFDMFAELQNSSELRLKLSGAELTGASIDQGSMSISLDLVTKLPLQETDAQIVRESICRVYGFQSVTLNLSCKEQLKPVSHSAPPPSGGGKPTGKVILGNDGTALCDVSFSFSPPLKRPCLIWGKES